jgi:hypothetical protein
MDYPGDPTQDTNDIGPYDKAAMRFGYANLVDVEKNMTVRIAPNGTPTGSGADFIAPDGFGGIFGNSRGTYPDAASGFLLPNHYSMYADRYGLVGTCAPRANFTGDPSDPLAQQCAGPDLAFVAERDMRAVPNVVSFAVDPNGRVRHPYMFGGDEFADHGNVPVFRFDVGADSYEQMQFFISTYENRYIFDNFRRNRVTFDTYQTVSRIEDRYWDKVQAITKSLALGLEFLTQPKLDPTRQPGLLMPMALASADGLSMFIRAMTRPEPGAYGAPAQPGLGGPPNAWTSTYAPLPAIGLPTVNVSLGDGEGRFLHNDFDFTQGYYWVDYQKQVGSAYEKTLASYYLTEAYNNFISNSKDDYIDGRYKNLSYASIYPNQIRRIFANLMATESATLVLDGGASAQIFTLAPYTTEGAGGATTPVQYLPWDKYDPNDPSTTQLQYPPNAVLLDPLVGWEEQYPSLINLFYFGPTSMNMDLIDQMRIFSPGDAASLSLPASQQVRYRDPLTGIEYVAKNYGTEVVNPKIGFDVAKTIGARMLQHANHLAQIAYQVSLPADPTTGELTYDVDGQGNAIPNADSAAQTAATMLKSYASNIDVVRQLTLFFGYGPLGH